MKYDDKNERFFKNIASLYAEKEGGLLKEELAELEKENDIQYSPHLDRKIKNRILSLKMRKLSYALVPVAACFLLLAVYFGSLPANNRPNGTPIADNAPADSGSPIAQATAPAAPHSTPAISAELLSARLPYGYEITEVDYDKEKTIFHIINDTNNEIVLTMEEAAGQIAKNAFQEIVVNNTPVYGLVKKDYSVITYEKDDILYTLTSKYNYKDLIEISKNLI